MDINYYIVENKLTLPTSYTGRPVSTKVLSGSDIGNLINTKLPTISAAIVETCLELLRKIVLQEITNGNAITLTNFISFTASMPGRFSNYDFQPSSSDLNPSFIVSRTLIDEINAIATFNRLGVISKMPSIMSATDTNTGVEDWIRTGYALDIKGNNLEFDFNDSEQGLFFSSPAGNTYRINNVPFMTSKRIIAIPSIDENEGPAGAASVAYGMEVRTRYTAGRDLRTGSWPWIRKTNVIGEGNDEVFVIGNAATGPARITAYTGEPMTARIVAAIRPDNVLTISAGTLMGELGAAVQVTGNGTYSVDGLDGLEIEVTDYATLYGNVLYYQRNLQEIVNMLPENNTVIFHVTELLSSPSETGVTWLERNVNNSIAAIGDGRFVWIGRGDNDALSPPPPGAYSVMGQVDEDGNVTYGSLVADFISYSYLSSNTYGICAIGNNKYARFVSVPNKYNFLVWDCGTSGLTPTLIQSNDFQTITILPGGWRDGILYSNGKIYVFGDNALQRCDIDNVTGLTSNMIQLSNFWTETGTPVYESGDMGEMRADAIPGGGVLCVVRTGMSPNAKLYFIATDGVTKTAYQCSDTDGKPLALAINSNGVFCACYITSAGGMRVRTGQVSGQNITFGASVDIYMFAGLYPCDMLADGNNFILAIQDYSNAKQFYVLLEADGTLISCSDEAKLISARQIASTGTIQIIPSGFNGKYLVANYGGGADFPIAYGRYVTMIGLRELEGVLEEVECQTDEWKYFEVEASASITMVIVELTNLTADFDLYIEKNVQPDFDSESSTRGGTKDEMVVVDNTEACTWHIGVYGYDAGAGTLKITLS